MPISRRGVEPGGNFFAGVLLVTGALHFLITPFYLRAMPSYLPHPRALVWASGAVSVGLGLLLLYPGTRRAAAWGSVLYLLAVFPANIHTALHPGNFPSVPVWLHWVRLPLQGFLIYWAYRYTKPAAGEMTHDR